MDTGTQQTPRIGDWRSWEELEALQSEQLPRSLANAQRVAFYQSRIPEDLTMATASDLTTLPVTTKRDLREAYPFGLLAVSKERLVHYFESSGTTGGPVSSYFTEEDWSHACNLFARSAVEFTPSDTVMVRNPYSMTNTGHIVHGAARLRGAMVVPAGVHPNIMPRVRVMQLLRELAVTVIWCLPSECLLWAAAARYAGYDPKTNFPELRAFLIGGESISDAKRARISEVWGGKQVIDAYGITETAILTGECREGNLHLWADSFIPEIYEPETKRFKREGTGNLVVTSLHREAMPLIRYDLEDFVELTYSACDCGWHLPLVRVRDRMSSRVEVGGRSFFPTQLEELIFRLPREYEVWFWRARCASSGLEIEIEVPEENKSSACSELAELVAAHLGVEADVGGVPPGTLVSKEALTRRSGAIKPRSFFREGEDWTAALIR